MYVSTSEIVQKANSIVAQCGTRDPLRIAMDLGIEVMYYPFNEQRGAYKVLMRNRFIFVKNDLHPVMENIVLLHELGHDALHREEATKVGGFKEFEIFNMRDNRMEYEANLFAAQISLSDEDFLELAERGYDTQQIARTLNSDINLVALKADTLISQGYRLRQQEHCNDFLRYNKRREALVLIEWAQVLLVCYRKSLRCFARDGCLSFRIALVSIWRIRSRVTPNCFPTSSSVLSFP